MLFALLPALALMLCALATAQRYEFEDGLVVLRRDDAAGLRFTRPAVQLKGDSLYIQIDVEDDNNDVTLPTAFRRWFGAGISAKWQQLGLTSLRVSVRSVGFEDPVRPVFAVAESDEIQVPFDSFEHIPENSEFALEFGEMRFTLPASFNDDNEVRFSKFFPYTLRDANALTQHALDLKEGDSFLFESTEVGESTQKRLIHMLSTSSEKAKTSVYIHAGIHPSESTSYHIMRGFMDALLTEQGKQLRERSLVHLVPLCNPDGLAAANYRTTSLSENLEVDWRAKPNESATVEVQALHTNLERLMESERPPSVVLNLHTTHDSEFGGFFVHTATDDWKPGMPGVRAEVNLAELRFVRAWQHHSKQMKASEIWRSTLATHRNYLEAVVHDRWSTAKNPIVAITMEGAYMNDAETGTLATPETWRTVGAQLVPAMLEYLKEREPTPLKRKTDFSPYLVVLIIFAFGITVGVSPFLLSLCKRSRSQNPVQQPLISSNINSDAED
ncbi:MAG: hypothetical protein MHM6MM_000108 [Cercozoa sp. M6MM]